MLKTGFQGTVHFYLAKMCTQYEGIKKGKIKGYSAKFIVLPALEMLHQNVW